MRTSKTLLAVFTLFVGSAALAQTDKDQVVISRGSAALTLADMDGRMSRLPEHERPDYAQRPDNMVRLMDSMLLNRQLANEAKDMGLDRNPDVQRDMQLAIEEVLAVHRTNALIARDLWPDFRQLARERYLADPGRFNDTEKSTVKHVLVKTETHGDEALARATMIREKALAPGSDFDALMREYSEDAGSANSAEAYVIDKPGEYVAEFDAAGRALKEPGDISDLIQSQFGYHIIKLIDRQPARTRTFEEVEGELMAQVRTDFLNRARQQHRAQLSGLPDEGNEELLLKLPERYGAVRMDAVR